jgi:hypothetical protein
MARMTEVRLSSLREARSAVRALLDRPGARPLTGSWTLAQILDHCAQSIDASIRGFPLHKPAIVKKTVGRLVLWRFLDKGRMSHDRNGPIPGLPPPVDAPLEDAVNRLTASMDAFLAFEGEPAPHFVYGPATKDQYDRVHAMHIADHLGDIGP